MTKEHGRIPSMQCFKLGSLNIKMDVSEYEENVHCFLIIWCEKKFGCYGDRITQNRTGGNYQFLHNCKLVIIAWQRWRHWFHRQTCVFDLNIQAFTLRSLQTVWTQIRPDRISAWSGSKLFDTQMVFILTRSKLGLLHVIFFLHIHTKVMALDLHQNFISAQYIENKLTEFHQILCIHWYWQDLGCDCYTSFFGYL